MKPNESGELPGRPPIVYARHTGSSIVPTWYMLRQKGRNTSFTPQDDRGWVYAENLSVVLHEQNDPEAVRIIEEAKR